MTILPERAWRLRYQALAGTARYREIPDDVYSDEMLRACFHPPFDVFANLIDGRSLVRCPDYWLDEANQRTGGAAESPLPSQWLILSQDAVDGLRADLIADRDVDYLLLVSAPVKEGSVN